MAMRKYDAEQQEKLNKKKKTGGGVMRTFFVLKYDEMQKPSGNVNLFEELLLFRRHFYDDPSQLSLHLI